VWIQNKPSHLMANQNLTKYTPLVSCHVACRTS
jgi:hypothetical protein